MLLKVKELRKARGLTVEQLASKAGLSKSFLSEIENGIKQINGRRLEDLAAALGVRPRDLIADATLSREIADHLDVMSKLDPEDQAAVHRHALSLLRARAPE
jgi:transcriptional regulator with XRE-family HTH domain